MKAIPTFSDILIISKSKNYQIKIFNWNTERQSRLIKCYKKNSKKMFKGSKT